MFNLADFGRDLAVNCVIIALKDLMRLLLALFVGDFPDGLVLLLLVPVRSLEIRYFLLRVVVELELQERFSLHVFSVYLFWRFYRSRERVYILIPWVLIFLIDLISRSDLKLVRWLVGRNSF